jgi:hypothetical protein
MPSGPFNPETIAGEALTPVIATAPEFVQLVV